MCVRTRWKDGVASEGIGGCVCISHKYNAHRVYSYIRVHINVCACERES